MAHEITKTMTVDEVFELGLQKGDIVLYNTTDFDTANSKVKQAYENEETKLYLYPIYAGTEAYLYHGGNSACVLDIPE